MHQEATFREYRTLHVMLRQLLLILFSYYYLFNIYFPERNETESITPPFKTETSKQYNLSYIHMKRIETIR